MNANLENLDTAVATADRNARHYWFEDGLTELVTGALFALVGLLFLAEARAVVGSPLAGMSALLLPLLIVCGVFIVQFVVRTLKERITYPRTGYVAYPEGARPRRRWPAAIVAVALGGLVALLFAKGPASLAWLPALDGLVIGTFLLVLGARLDLARFYVLALVSALIGLAVTLSGAVDPLGSAAYFGSFGLVLMAVGAWVLTAYLRRTSGVAGQA